MAKSFHNIIKEGSFVVLHKGNEVTLDLPTWLIEAGSSLNNEANLLQWAQDNKILHGLLHMAIQQLIIALRAKARPPIDLKTGDTLSIITEKKNAQKRVFDYILKPVPEPGTQNNKKISEALQKEREKMRKAMEVAGIAPEKIDEIIADIK